MRLVQAQDEERQRIERNLHDGAQQQLVALTVQLSLLEESAEDPDGVRQMTRQLRSGLRAAVDDLRALARGIYPPLLADQGLGPGLRAQASRAPLPVLIEADGIGRYPAGRRSRRLLLHPGGAAKRRQVRPGLAGHRRPVLPRQPPGVHRHRRRRRFRHCRNHVRHRPAGHGRPASRGWRHPAHQLRARARHRHRRQAAGIRVSLTRR